MSVNLVISEANPFFSHIFPLDTFGTPDMFSGSVDKADPMGESSRGNKLVICKESQFQSGIKVIVGWLLPLGSCFTKQPHPDLEQLSGFRSVLTPRFLYISVLRSLSDNLVN